MDLFVLVWQPLLVGRIWESSSSLPMITNDDDMIRSSSCPLIPRSSTLWTVTGIRNDLFIYLLFFLFICFWLLWRLGFCSALIALWQHGTHHGHVFDFDWSGGLVSSENRFRFPAFFKAKPFDFWLSFFHFFIFSLRLVFLTPLVVNFALSLLSFLPNFQVRPLFTLFSFLNFACIPVC